MIPKKGHNIGFYKETRKDNIGFAKEHKLQCKMSCNV